jgi:hypothetical protein
MVGLAAIVQSSHRIQTNIYIYTGCLISFSVFVSYRPIEVIVDDRDCKIYGLYKN